MIVLLSQLTDTFVRNRLWLFSLGAAAAINGAFILLASIAPMGHLPKLETATRPGPVEIVMRRRVPPPPDLSATADAPSSALPRRFRPRTPILQTLKSNAPDFAIVPPRLRLNLAPCDLNDPDGMRRPDCRPPQDWLRADRDASELLGSSSQGYTLDEVAIARGWIRPKSRTGQDALAAATDATLPESIFKDPPFPPHSIERTGGW